jgi:hypothetical protein
MTDAKRDPQGPPKDVPASELWLAMTTLPVPHVIEDMPVKEPIYGKSIGKVAIVPLSPEELQISRTVAGQWATKRTGETPKNGEESPAYFAVMASEAAVQILWRALRDPNDPTLKKPAIPAAMLLRQAPFTDDIHVVLMRMYTRACVVCGPIVATMTDEERDAWLDALEEGGSAFPLDLLSSDMKTELLMHSVARLKKCQTANGLRGPQPDGASTDAPVKLQSDEPPTLPDSEPPSPALVDDLVIPKV